MNKRTKVWAGVGAGVVVLGVVAVAVGPGLYADWANSNAEAAPTLEASATGGPVAATDGTWTVADGSFAGYRVEEVLRGEDVTVTGRTEDVTGSVTVEGGSLTAAEIEVDMASIATDEPPRDNYFRDQAVQVGTFPTATFTLTEPVELGDGVTSAQLTGDLTIRDVTQEVTVDAQVAGSGDAVQVVGSVPVTFADFGVQAPSLGFVTVEDTGAVEFDLRLTAS
ncbi:YceI family protein [Cellulomonas wangsupingiae]|uniref:YceI family protein n=1 Tax=Cellulomonas wangsupingiae TaxID=2968085 RepID=UPI001D0F3B87|nr:YceI family protein [Cellulomonas wangsupingiae]MCM0639410.1 YceI family protein [Cellulomonas wangsupingiae]